MEKIILASSSPRRRELLDRIGCEFEVIVPDAVEPLPAIGEDAHDFVRRSAVAKCSAVSAAHPERVVLAADTIVVLDGDILGKPRGADDAFSMLKRLVGRTHQVMSCVAARRGEHSAERLSITDVSFRGDITDDELRRYVATGEPLDKAGAYGIQGLGSLLVRKIDGDYFGVVGLPMTDTASILGEFGIELL